MNQNLRTLARITAATALTLGAIAVPYRWHKNRTHAATPIPGPTTDFQIFDAPGDEALNTMATAINNRGDVVGIAFDATGQKVQPFHVKDRAFHLLPNPRGAEMGFAQGVNDRGVVVGSALTGDTVQATVWRDGKPASLDAGVTLSAASGINDSGQIVGSGKAATDGDLVGLLWERNGKAKRLGAFALNAIADNGFIVGVRVKNDTFQPIAVQDGKVMALPLPAGAAGAVAGATNGKSAIVGAALVGDRFQAVCWDRSKATLLPGLRASGLSSALSVNHKGDIVGTSETGEGEFSATLWRNGKPMDLNEMVPDRSGWRAVVATGINSNGFVTGWAMKGERVSGFLLGPIR